MRVSQIGLQYSAVHNLGKKVVTQPLNSTNKNCFKGSSTLKFGDYVVGAICGSAMAAVGFAVAGPIGAITLGMLGAKSTAEANNETRTE